MSTFSNRRVKSPLSGKPMSLSYAISSAIEIFIFFLFFKFFFMFYKPFKKLDMKRGKMYSRNMYRNKIPLSSVLLIIST